MKYFVSIENNVYCHWQVELLIESFKMLGLQDDLLISVAENKSPSPDWFVKNVKAHKHKFQHFNYGATKGNVKLNKLYSLYAALKEGLIEQPLTLLHMDMLLVNPIVINKSETANLIYEKNDSSDEFTNVMKKDMNPWMDIGSSITFLDCKLKLFEHAINRMNELTKKGIDSNNLEKIAWMLAAYNQNNLFAKQTFSEMSLLSDSLSGNIIHYRHGLPPVFSKHSYKYLPPSYFSAGNPHDALLDDVSPVMHHVQKIVNSYKETIP